MKRKLTFTLIALLAVALLASAAWAQRPGRGQRGPDGDGLLRWAEELKLTDQQKDQLQKLRTDHQLQMVERRAALETAEIQLASLMRSDAAEAEVLAKIDEVTKLRGEMQKSRYQHRNQMHGVLTEEQEAQLEKLRDEFRAEHREMRQGKQRGERMMMRHGEMDGRGPQGGHGF